MNPPQLNRARHNKTSTAIETSPRIFPTPSTNNDTKVQPLLPTNNIQSRIPITNNVERKEEEIIEVEESDIRQDEEEKSDSESIPSLVPFKIFYY
ncbi:hypothetical protein QL285_030429 [Trifolium repens]|jgi:hypothetical protein|nr:hypothetical protein QL285_030429 [Trifolium repens]